MMCVRVHNLLGTSSRDRWGVDLLREGDDAHDRRDDDVHRVVLVVGAVAEYRGACVNEDAVGACLAAARCSIIDAEEVGGPTTCGDSIEGRVHRV